MMIAKRTRKKKSSPHNGPLRATRIDQERHLSSAVTPVTQRKKELLGQPDNSHKDRANRAHTPHKHTQKKESEKENGTIRRPTRNTRGREKKRTKARTPPRVTYSFPPVLLPTPTRTMTTTAKKKKLSTQPSASHSSENLRRLMRPHLNGLGSPAFSR